jgi:two-component system, OmpR family, response regulator
MTATGGAEARARPETLPLQSGLRTLLVVDDDEEIRTLGAELLAKAGYNVMTASDGPSMFAALDAHPVDLIVLDLNLPGEDGLSLCRMTRAGRNTPIIMLTARSEAIDRSSGSRSGPTTTSPSRSNRGSW